MKQRARLEVFIVIGILIIASFFRFYQLAKYPPGLYPDEAMDGSNALVVNQTGHYQLFYTENNGREGLYINFQALSVKISGIHAWALRDVSGIFGILTVLGLYLFAKELFDWRVGAVSSFLLAISFWHVNFSRIGFDGIMVPFILVYAFYFLWRALKRNNYLDFFWAGIFVGLGFYTYSAYRVSPLIFVALFVSYWLFLKKDFGHPKYEHARNRLLGGFCVLAITTFFVALPMGIYFLRNPEQLTARTNQVSVFQQAHPLSELANSTVRTLGMFTFAGDLNQRDNIAGEPMLGWPIAILFAIGFLKELYHWLRRKHGHLSPVHTLMFAWFFVMLFPGFLSVEAPHALRAIGVLPIVMIFAARGLLWLLNTGESWEMLTHPWEGRGHNQFVAPVLACLALMVALGFYEYNRYFNVWAPSQATAEAFTANSVDIANQINAMPAAKKKYVIVDVPAVEAYGLPVSAETVMFLTDTVIPSTQRAKNVTYLTPTEAVGYHFPSNATIWHIR